MMNNEELNYRLIDTSHTDSSLEVLVGRSLGRLTTSSTTASSSGGNINYAGIDSDNDDTYHVMIKIWHTHLGYERTMLSIQDSLSDILPGIEGGKAMAQGNNKVEMPLSTGGAQAHHYHHHPNVRIHAILQYPRCYDSIFSSPQYLSSPNFPKKYTNCHTEEDESIDKTTKSAGPSPLLDKEDAWKRSYRALEELYHHGTLESIGIANFGPADLSALFELATVGPHIYQGTLATLMTQEDMVEELVRHGVHYQCYDAVSTIMDGKEGAPMAYEKLLRIGAKHGSLQTEEEDGNGYSAVQVVLGWLVHHRGVGVVPGTTNVAHLAENSPSSLASMPRFTPREALDIETAVLALVKGDDGYLDNEGGGDALSTGGSAAEDAVIDAFPNLGFGDDEDAEGIVATFFNTLPSRHVKIFQIHPTTGEQMQLSHGIPPGRSGRLIVNREDVLIAYDGHGSAVKKFLVGGVSSVDFTVE